MNTVDDLLHNLFGREEPKKPEEYHEPEPPKKKKKEPKYITDPYVGASAQRFYDPNFKGIIGPPPKAPPAKQVNLGTAPDMNTSGAWGTPEKPPK